MVRSSHAYADSKDAAIEKKGTKHNDKRRGGLMGEPGPVTATVGIGRPLSQPS